MSTRDETIELLQLVIVAHEATIERITEVNRLNVEATSEKLLAAAAQIERLQRGDTRELWWDPLGDTIPPPWDGVAVAQYGTLVVT